MRNDELIAIAKEARKNAYAPYSGFKVGAALLCADGEVFLGANVENASYSLTCCAERSALFAAVSNGKRNFEAIAIVGGKTGEDIGYCPPCGACRQALDEFSGEDGIRVILVDKGEIKTYSLNRLLPNSFGEK